MIAQNVVNKGMFCSVNGQVSQGIFCGIITAWHEIARFTVYVTKRVTFTLL